ncbi:MAG: GFA family protein [Solirubrobacteraceae bacterium]|nr:GFA family protein [Solirubrobacteraceae bacterium]
MANVLTGGCNCGAVRYEVSGPLTGATYCHCKRCQRRSGAAASPSAHPAPGTFRITKGEHVLRCWAPDDGGEKWFCSLCGSSIYAQRRDGSGTIGIRMGTFDNDPGVRPGSHVWCESAAAWEPIPDDGLPRYPRTTGAGVEPRTS